MSNATCDTGINRDGSGQLNRYLKALDPSYAPVDGRTTEDLLVFAKRYAAQIRFYDIPGGAGMESPDHSKISWKEFFRRDMAVIAASIALTDLEQIKKEYEDIRERVEEHPVPGTFENLFDPILGMIIRIDKWYSIAIPENPLHNDLKLAIDSNLREQLQTLIAYGKGLSHIDANHRIRFDLTHIENPDVWSIANTIPANNSIYQGQAPEEKIRHAALYVDTVYNSFFGFISSLVAQSERYMHFALENYPAHQPHMALFITFLKLFKLAQEQMNGLTEKMLNFYYQDVLHLEEKPSIPDRAHIVFELAKEVAEFSLKRHTPLHAGKDASGKEQVYKTENDIVINQARVAELKTIFIEKGPAENIQKILARPVANSSDGFGEAFTDPYPKWPTFGIGDIQIQSENKCDELLPITNPSSLNEQAQIGFAIASPQLVLQGGNRIIALKMQEFNIDTANTQMEIWLSTEDGWLKINKQIKDKTIEIKNLLTNGGDLSTVMPVESGYFFDFTIATTLVPSYGTLYICLPIIEKAIVPFNKEKHKESFYKTEFPIMQVMLGPEINLDSTLFNFKATDVSLSVRVGSINNVQTPIVLKGWVYRDPENTTPLEGVHIINFDIPSIQNSANDGAFSVSALSGNNIIFRLQGYKTQIMPITAAMITAGEFGVIMIEGNTSSSDSDLSTLIEHSFSDGLSELALQNGDGLITTKPFDPFTAYPTNGSTFYIGSDEIFNKPVDELEIHIKHLSDNADEDYNSKIIKHFQSYKLSVLEKKKWRDLCTSDGRNFTKGDLTRNILFGKINSLPNAFNLPRNLPSYLPGFTDQSVNRFIQLQLQNNIPIDILDNGGIGSKDDSKGLLEQMTELALVLKVSEISLSYFSTLQSLEPGIDQFFHIYPFGVVETYTEADSTQPVFSTLDKKKGGLLVDAKKHLLPQFKYLSPYGTNAVNSFNNQYSDTSTPSLIQEEGLLFIGLEKLKPLQTVSLLFQFAEGSAEDEDNDPPPIHWSYLTNNEWRPMKNENLISDGTYGFQTTGIVKIDVPADATNHNTIITDDLHWFCVSVMENSNRIPQLVNVVAQAALVKFEGQGNDPARFDKALAAGSIGKLAVAVAEVKKVEQPFASFDGKRRETGKEFYTRVSERLRHKGRTINAWDYEHLVLDRFPGIYKVKCITHTDPDCLCRKSDKLDRVEEITLGNSRILNFNTSEPTLDSASVTLLANVIKAMLANPSIILKLTAFLSDGDLGKERAAAVLMRLTDNNISKNRYLFSIIPQTGGTDSVKLNLSLCCGPQIAPGHVLLVPIPNLKNRNAANPLQPKTNRRTLLEIEAFLKKHSSVFVKVHAKNPVYEQVRVSFKVKFHTGTDKGYFLKKLNEEIVQYLTPWAFDENAEVKFGQKIYASSIINFIEERNYVDFITEFKMSVCREACCSANDAADKNLAIIVPSTARSIIVSARQHEIFPYDPDSTSGTASLGAAKEPAKLTGNIAVPLPAEIVSTPGISAPKPDPVKTTEVIIEQEPTIPFVKDISTPKSPLATRKKIVRPKKTIKPLAKPKKSNKKRPK